MRFRNVLLVTQRLSIGLAIALALTIKVASTQMSLAAFRGTVIDEQGAVQLDVVMTAHNIETNETWNVTTGRLGQYFLPNLPTGGSYELTAELAQFTPDKRAGLVLRVGQEVTVDFVLRLKGLTAELNVVAEGLALDMTKNALGTIITKEQIDNLPTIERDFSSLAVLSSGVTIGAGGNGFSIGFNGQPGFSNGFFVDGVTAEWQYYGKQSSTFVQDWIQEFQVMTNSYTAEFGTASGGIVNAITRRGTNGFHGRGYGFFQEGALDANPFAGNFDDNGNPQYLKEKPPTSQYRLGGFIGGPIVKDRLFFFAGYERPTKDSLAVLSISEYWRNQGIKSVLPALSRDNPFLVRVDADFNSRNRVTFRYDRTGREDTNQTQSGSGAVEEARYTFRGPVWNIMGNWTSTLGNTKFNEFRAFFGSNKKPIICNKSGTGGFDNLRERPGTFSIQFYPGACVWMPVLHRARRRGECWIS
jgi:hypothetical protein